jgi:hypothetical protein
MLLCHAEPNVVGEPYLEHEYMVIIIKVILWIKTTEA